MSTTSKTRIVIGPVRFSYVHVFEPTKMDEDSKAKYNVSILIDKKDKKSIAKVKNAIKAAAEAGKAKLGGKIPKNLKTPLRDGDEDRPDDEAYEGKYFINASSIRKPGVVDSDLNEIIDREEFYSGCHGRVCLNFYTFNVGVNKGVAAGLEHLQKLKDGEPLSGEPSAEDVFGELDDDFDDFSDDDEDDALAF